MAVNRAFGILSNLVSTTTKAISAKFSSQSVAESTQDCIVFVRKDLQSSTPQKSKFCTCIASRIDLKTGKCSCGLPIKQSIHLDSKVTVLDDYDPKNNEQYRQLLMPTKGAEIDLHAPIDVFSQQFDNACMHMFLDSSIAGDHR
jgi:hypothetical protein